MATERLYTLSPPHALYPQHCTWLHDPTDQFTPQTVGHDNIRIMAYAGATHQAMTQTLSTLLGKLVQANKKFFLINNSPFENMDAELAFMVGKHFFTNNAKLFS